MSSEKEQKSHFIFLNITVAVWTTVMFVLFPACSRGEKNLAEAITERDSLPSMKTLGVTTLISDSGITRYKIITEEWEIYDKKNPPYWAFEKGVYLEKFDSLFHIDASIKADRIGNKQSVIPFINHNTPLEYEITRLLKQSTDTLKPSLR